MDCKLQNKDQVSIIHISWEFELNEALEKLQDLHKSGVIVYAVYNQSGKDVMKRDHR